MWTSSEMVWFIVIVVYVCRHCDMCSGAGAEAAALAPLVAHTALGFRHSPLFAQREHSIRYPKGLRHKQPTPLSFQDIYGIASRSWAVRSSTGC